MLVPSDKYLRRKIESCADEMQTNCECCVQGDRAQLHFVHFRLAGQFIRRVVSVEHDPSISDIAMFLLMG